jgi:hypothetical protein
MVTEEGSTTSLRIVLNCNSTARALLKFLCCSDLCVVASHIAFRPIVAYFDITKINVRPGLYFASLNILVSDFRINL